MNSLYKRYPCPNQGHLDFTMKIDEHYDGGKLISYELTKSWWKNTRVRTHKLVNCARIWREIEVTPRSPNSRWYM